MRRRTGEIQQGSDGNYELVNGNSWGEAVYKGATAAAIENYTEMLGAHINIGKNVMNFLPKIGMGRVSDWFLKAGKQNWYNTTKEWLSRMGVNGYGGEVLEEEIAIPLNAILVGDNPLLFGSGGLLDTDTQIDILGGMALSIAGMNAGTLAAYGTQRGVYAAMTANDERRLNNADATALEVLGTKWNDIKDDIDNTPNDAMPELMKEYADDETMSKEEKEAVGGYITSLLRSRGHNLGQNAVIQADEEEQTVLDNNLTPEEQQNVHEDGMIHTALLYPTAENGGEPQEVFITKGNVVMRGDGTVDTEASSNAIYYKGSDGQVHMTSPDKIQSVNEPISVEEYAAAGAELTINNEKLNSGNDAEQYAVGDEVNVNIGGNNYTATVQGTDGNGNVQVYYQNEDGIDVPATFTIEELRNMNRPNDEQPPMGGAGAVIEEPTGQNGNIELQNIPENGNIGAENITQSGGMGAENGENNVENSQHQQQSVMPKDAEGNPIYDQAPVEATISDLYDGSLDDAEVQGFINANINEAQKRYDNAQKKAPKIGTNKAKYLEQKRKWQADVDEAKRVLDYWNEVNAQKESITHTTPQEIEAAQAELSGQNAREEYAAMNENVPTNSVTVASDFIRGAKITPESFRAETGYGAGEQRRFVGMIATEQNGGKSIDRLAEELVSYDNAELNGITFNGDTGAAKDAILEALHGAGTRGELTVDNTAEQERYVDARRAELDAQYLEAYGMTYEDYLAYEEQNLPEMLRKYANFDEVEFYNLYADEIELTLNSRINEQGNDTTGEEPRAGGGDEVLLGEGTDNARGSAGGTEQGTEVPTGVQGTAEDGTVSEQTSAGNGQSTFIDVIRTLYTRGKEVASRLFSMKFFDVATTPKFMKDLGLRGDKFTIRYGVISRHFNKDNEHDLPEEIWEQLPTAIQNPFAITRYFTDENRKQQKGYRLYTTLQLGNGSYVVVSAEVKNAGRDLEVNAINTVFGRNVLSDVHDELIYTSETITPEQQSLLNGNNPRQYPANRELSESKDTQTSTNEQTIGEKFAQNKEETKQHEAELASRVEVRDDDWQEGDTDKPTYKRSIIIDGKHTATQVDQPDTDGHYTGSYFEFDNKRFGDIAEIVNYIDNGRTLTSKIAKAEAETDTEPTEAQKEAGNYKKGHVKIDGFDVTIEIPKGSVRSGKDADGTPWSVTMNNTYGYIRGTEGVDGDHIDVFLTNDIDGWNGRRVYIVDQYNEDGTFDEHKVMLGFNDEAEAQDAYLSNYEKGWSFKHKLILSSVNLPDFEKWINSSHRKTKPFAEYKSVNKEIMTNEPNTPETGFEIAPAQYTTKRGKVLDMFLVTFVEPLSKEQQRAARELTKTEKGWYDRDKGGFMMRSEESARKLADTITGNEEAVSDAQPLSLADTRKLEEPAMRQVDVEGLMQAIRENGEAKLSDHFVPQSEQKEENSTQETENSEQEEENAYGASNKLVSRERYEQLKARMRRKLGGQLNMGIDPEILAIGTEMAAYHIEAGARKFADYAKNMISDLGDAIRPYLKSFYNGARDLPEVQEAGLDNEMTPYDEVRKFDVANFDKEHVNALDTAQMVVQEQEVDKQADVAKKRLTDNRNSQNKEKKSKKKTVTSQPQSTDLFGGQFDKNTSSESAESQDNELNRKFAMTVKDDMLAALDNGTKPYRSILDLRKRAAGLGMDVDNEGRTDILLQELVEDGLVRAAREVAERHGSDSKETYDLICKLYEMQPTIAARSSNRIKMQQYSTPLPMAWNAARFVMTGKKDGKVLEPTAGNGMLVFAIPTGQIHANELDGTRLANLREQGFSQVTQKDATESFEGGKQYDMVIANPPFGKREAVEYDGKLISGLDPQITLNALASMKDDGRAAIIIGGNMEYAKNGGLKSMKPFFTYLYDHYNVKGVVDMDSSLYAKQGTTYPTRMILIDGRRSEEERAQSAIYPPVQSKAIRKADSFEALYDIIDEVINSKEKTNGTEILRSQKGQLASVTDQPSRNTDGKGHREQPRTNDDARSRGRERRNEPENNSGRSQQVLPRERREDNRNGETRNEVSGNTAGGSRGVSEPDVQRVGAVGASTERMGLTPQRASEQPKKRTLTEEKSAYRPHNSAFSLQSVAPAAMVEAMDRVLSQIEEKHGSIDEFVRKELGYDTIEEAHQALAAEQIDSVAMAIYQMKQGQALIIGDQTGVGKGRQMAALIRWAVKRGEKPIFITQKADLFSDIYRDLVDIGSGDLVPFIFNSDGAMVDSNGNTVHKPLSSKEMAKVFAAGVLPDEYDFAVLTYSQVNTGDEVSQKEMEEAKKNGVRSKKSKNVKNGKATPKATFLRAIAEDNYLFLDESHTAAGSSNTGAYLQSILRSAKAATFASATFAKRPDTMPLYAIRTAMSQAKVEPDKLISIIEKGGVTLQEIMSRELTNAGQMVRRERDMSDVVTDWKIINDPATVKRARENYDRTIAAFNAIIKFQEDYVKPMVDAMDKELAVMAESAGIKRGTDKMGVENVPFASKTYNYTKQLMLALKVDAIANEVDAEIKAGRHPVIALESTMESSIKDYSAGEVFAEPTFSASLLRGLDSVMQYTIKDENGKEQHERYSPKQLGEAGEKAYYELQDFIRKSTSDIFISPLDAIIERLHDMGYKVGELTGRNLYVERDSEGRVVVKRRTDKDKKRMQREFNNGELDVLILNKSASTGISLHASEKFSDQRQRTMIIAQPLSDINDYMQMIGRIDRTGQVHRGYYINLGLPVPAENRFLMMLSTKLKSLNANTTTSQDNESNDVEAPDLLNKYGSQVVVEYLRDNPDIYEKMGSPLKKTGQGGGRVQTSELDEYKPQEDDARKITGYVALLTTQEQEDFYNDVVRRYNEFIKYLNDTGNNDLKITVMPLRAKTLEKRVSSEGIDPTGANPFAQNSYVEQVEMDVLRKPMKAAEIRKTIEQVNKGERPEYYIRQIISTIEKEDEAKIAAEEARYERAKARAQEDIAKQTEKINRQQKRSAEEKQAAIADYVKETNENVEAKHSDNLVRLNTNSDMLKQRLHMFEVGMSYLMPDNLESMVFDSSTPTIFCGYKAKDSKISASTTLAVFATLDGRRRVEVKLSDIAALRSIYKTTNDNWDAARSTTLENWDSQIPTGTRKTGYIMTGNILQAIADTQDERGGFPGQLISYTDIDGNVHDGILMPDKWNRSMLKTSGAPIISRIKQIKDYMPVTSHDGKVEITGSSWARMYYLTVPKTKKDGAVYYENKTLLRAVNGGNFYPYRGKLRADIPAENIESVVKELSKLGVKVQEEAKEDDVMLRNGNGALTDDNLANANDHVSKLLEKSTRTARQRREFAERERKRMIKRVQELAQTLHLDNVDIVADASTLRGSRAKAKGFFSRSTGKIIIVISNHRDLQDVEQTLLHEAVAHYGLRQLFGEHFDTFIDNVYNNVSPELKQRIDAMSQEHGWSTRVSTEEYLASLAENTNFKDMDAKWWGKIKQFFLQMLHKIGFEGFTGVTLTDNELRYLLWRSYENLAEPGRYRSIVGEARDIAKQHELNVGNYKTTDDVKSNAADRANEPNEAYTPQMDEENRRFNDDILYREAEEAEDDLLKNWREEYDRRTLSAAFKFREAAQDGMRSVSVLQDVISKETGSPIKEDENVWGLQNRLSSTNKYEQDYYYENYYKPLMREVGNLVKAGARYDELGRNMSEAEDDILKYLISKHGIERNAHFRDVAAAEARRPYEERIAEIRKSVEDGEITQEAADEQIEKLSEQANEAEEKSRIDTITRDYSGLSELYEDNMMFDTMAQEYVDNFESKFDTTELWNKINAATKATLQKTYENGLISRKQYEATRDMYEYYIPLRGWSNDVASEMYNYKGQQGVGGRIMKRAKGRKSLAENPLAVIGRMGQDGILQANKNKVKQRLYNLAVSHQTSLLSLKKQWYENVGTDENPEWERVYPELRADMSADEVSDAIEAFEENMRELREDGRATQRREGLTLSYHTTSAQEQQHRVNVSIGGREYNIYVNGNPRAAQAINGELRMDEGDSSIVQRVNRWLANVYTSLNPEFVVTNYERDAGFAAAIVASTETPQYQAGWIKNMAKFNPLTTGVYINALINKAIKGRVNPDNTTERYMQEFLANGGETGFTNMLTADDYKKLINKEIKNVNTGITARKAARVFSGAVQRANRVFEDATRFATYVTSREQGRSIDEAIREAKEISLNFNTRGADGMRNDGIVYKFFRNLRHWVIFTNPSIQGLNKAGVAFRNHPVRSTIAIAGLPVLLGYGMAALASALLGDDDDEKVREAYMDLPKWVRRTNICIPIGGTKFVTIPLSYELRVSYGLGEMFWEIEQGLIEPSELAKETLTQISDLLPLSFASGTVAQNVSPTIVRPLVDIIQNKDFTGRPIWRENTFNQNMPEYTKTYAGTAKWFTKSAEVLNNAIPKFWIKDYPSPDKYTPGALDINPAIVEHLFDSYLGGLYTFPAKAAKTISMVWDEDMRDVRNIPFLNRNIKDSRSGNPINRSAGNRYNTYMKEYRLTKQRWNGYRRETNHGVTDFLDKLTNFGNTPQGQRMFIIDGYKKSLDEIDKQIKDMGQYEGYGGDEERKRLKNISDSLKQELVNKLDSVSVVED